jgi:DNA-binding MarR family transcriptional regulator
MSESGLAIFADELNQLMPVIMREFARRQINELCKGRITLPQFLILEFLEKEQESKMTTLAQVMGVSTAAVTGIVERLVRQGFTLRLFDEDDRRVIKIKLTAKGETLVKKINLQRRQMVREIFAQISPEDRRDYIRILKRIKDILLSESLKKK